VDGTVIKVEAKNEAVKERPSYQQVSPRLNIACGDQEKLSKIIRMRIKKIEISAMGH
jgi:hypothetical protein